MVIIAAAFEIEPAERGASIAMRRAAMGAAAGLNHPPSSDDSAGHVALVRILSNIAVVRLAGTPSDELSAVLATGSTDVRWAFISLSAREPDGRDAEYLAWHSLDHRPEQHRLAGLRSSLRLVSTPACRAIRAASVDHYDAVDHVMTYLFSDPGALPRFNDLGAALAAGGRMPLRLPTVEFMTANLAGKVAAPAAVAGADVIPWRPALGVYLIIERGQVSGDALVGVPGVAGVWWYHGDAAPAPYGTDARGMQISYCYLDDDPIATSERLGDVVQRRWATGDVLGLLAAPFYTLAPFDWTRHLPQCIASAKQA